jgi:hypothetical protein
MQWNGRDRQGRAAEGHVGAVRVERKHMAAGAHGCHEGTKGMHVGKDGLALG